MNTTKAPTSGGLDAIFPDAMERRRYAYAVLRLAMRPMSARRIADRARLHYRLREVRAAMSADPRLSRVPGTGPERYVLRAEYRHATQLREAMV